MLSFAAAFAAAYFAASISLAGQAPLEGASPVFELMPAY
jgi:hypothetical protein